MIDTLYINEALRIREEYLNNLLYISNEEENLKKLTNNLSELSEEIENSESKDENYYKNALIEVEKMIQKANDKIKPYYDKIKDLDKQQRLLYNNIKEKYPNITDDKIKDVIIPHILILDEKIKNKYNKTYKN